MSERANVTGGVDLDEARPVVEPRSAATVIVLRNVADAAGTLDEKEPTSGVEVFCVRRHQGSPFMGGAVVFPGGKVDNADRDEAWSDLADPVASRTLDLCEEPGEARAIAVAAARELLEEAGILPAEVDAETTSELREEASDDTPLHVLFAQKGLRLSLGSLIPFARWVTPVAEKRRFDARFFLLRAPRGQEGLHDDRETTASFWATPAEVLARFGRGEIQLFPPTTRSLEILRDAKNVSDAFAIAERQDLRRVCPRFVPSDPPMLTLPGDPEHDEREVIVAGPSRFVLRDGRFVSEDP